MLLFKSRTNNQFIATNNLASRYNIKNKSYY